MFEEAKEKFLQGHDLLVGIDEVGRGPIAGPVSVAAFAVQEKYYAEVHKRLLGITDSKKLSEKKRDHFAAIIRELLSEGKIKLSISSHSAKIIDKKGIVPALKSALKNSLAKVSLDSANSHVYLDGSLYAADTFSQETIVKGDSKNWLIASASVAAKVSRDTQMKKLAKKFPEYSFEKHKGYGTRLHHERIAEHGTCEIHRIGWLKNI